MAELREESIDFTEIKNKLLQCTWADRLRSLGQNDDLAFCTQLNTHDIIPFYDKETKKIICR
jgi:phosphosulfolactate phosphohydrolase-like enzyme